MGTESLYVEREALIRERDKYRCEWVEMKQLHDNLVRQCSVLDAEIKRLRGGFALCIGLATDTPYPDVRPEDIDGYCERWAALATPAAKGLDQQRISEILGSTMHRRASTGEAVQAAIERTTARGDAKETP